MTKFSVTTRTSSAIIALVACLIIGLVANTSVGNVSPTDPKAKVPVCYKGKTKLVKQDKLQKYLNKGATLGACTGDKKVVICVTRKDGSCYNKLVNEKDVQKYLNKGATLGPCS
jgi:hypothetical protein